MMLALEVTRARSVEGYRLLKSYVLFTLKLLRCFHVNKNTYFSNCAGNIDLTVQEDIE